MKAQARRRETDRATYQDVLDAPLHMVAEVVAGTFHTHPRPAARHAWASSGFGMKIGPPFTRLRQFDFQTCFVSTACGARKNPCHYTAAWPGGF